MRNRKPSRPRHNFDSTLAATRRRAWKTTRTFPQRQRIMFKVNIKLMKNGFCSKLSDYADMSAGEASSEKKPSVDIHERPQKLRRSSRNRKSVNCTSEVEADDMNMSTENIEESCAGEEQVNLASACCPQDLSQLDTELLHSFGYKYPWILSENGRRVLYR